MITPGFGTDVANSGSLGHVEGRTQPPNGPKNAPKDASTLVQLLRVLVTHCLNQNDLMRNRTRLLIAVQGGVIAAAYYLSSPDQLPALAPYVLCGGAILTGLLTLLAIEDRQDRDANKILIRAIDQELMEILGWKDRHSYRFTNRPRCLVWADGDWILVAVFLSFFALDILLAFRGFCF